MLLSLEIDSNNVACQTKEDAAWILRNVADRIAEGQIAGAVKDQNGNRVGTYRWESTDDAELEAKADEEENE